MNDNEQKISIVMSYYDRFSQLIFTLKTITQQTKYQNYEIIIVDDASNDYDILISLKAIFNIDIKIIRVEPLDKKWINPCIPNNMGIDAATGDILVLQNPECFYVGDVLTELSKQVNQDNYVTCSCLSVSEEITNQLHQIRSNLVKEIRKILIPLPVCTFEDSKNQSGWSNHPHHKPTWYNFTAAITKENMNRLDGFDERFYNGLAWDDDEFINRVKNELCLKMEVMDTSRPFVVHQWHEQVCKFNNEEWTERYGRNKAVFEECTLNSTIKARRLKNDL